MRILVADVETTGLEEPINIVEVAWVEILKDLSVVPGSEFSSVVHPQDHINCSAAGVHGIRDSFFEESNDFMFLQDIPWPEEEVLVIAHNSKFDVPILSKHMNIVDEMCTLVLSRRLLPNAPDHKLSTLACYCDFPNRLSHRAGEDVKDCLDLLRYMAEGTGWDFDRLLKFYKTPQQVKVMPWGKHKGLPIEEVPKSYLAWASEQDLDPDMRYTIDLMLKRGKL